MTQQTVFTVATLGFEERERRLLRDLLRLSEYRTPTFGTHTPEAGPYPHVVIVKADQPDSLARWQAYRPAHEGRGKFSGLMLTCKELPSAEKHRLRLPFALPELFATLEQIVTADHGYKPSAVPTPHTMFVLSPQELAAPLQSPVVVPAEIAFDAPVLAPPAPEPVIAAHTPPQAVPVEPVAHSPRPALSIEPTVVLPRGLTPGLPRQAPVETSVDPGVTVRIPPNRPIVERVAESVVRGEAPVKEEAPAGDRDVAVILEPENNVAQTHPASVVAAGPMTLASSPAASHARANAPTAAREPRPATAGAAAGKPSPATASNNHRFLVIDDSLPVRIQMKTALQGLAKTIDFADTGEQALLLMDNCKYDVIFLDVILPGKDGYEVCRYIRKHPLQKATPVIMLTGNSAPADRVKGKLAGCDTYLVKPVKQSVLATVIGDFIKSTAAA